MSNAAKAIAPILLPHRSDTNEFKGDPHFHVKQTPGLELDSLVMVKPAEIEVGDWLDLRFSYRAEDLPNCYDSQLIDQLLEDYPGRLWEVLEAGPMVLVIQGIDRQFNRLRKQIRRAWRVHTPAPEVEPVLRGRDALGRGRGDGRRGGVRTVTVRRKRKGGRVWTGTQHQLQWEAKGVKHSRYLRKAIAPKVLADWEAGATVKELLETYKLVEPKHA